MEPALCSYSALKMDGKPLYEYARSGTPLPRPIPTRKVTVHSLELLRFELGDQHTYELPKDELEEDKRRELERLEKMVKEGGTTVPTEEDVAAEPAAPESSTTASVDSGVSFKVPLSRRFECLVRRLGNPDALPRSSRTLGRGRRTADRPGPAADL